MLLGRTASGEIVTLNPADLLTHAVVLGQTGSGKTGTTVTVIEEAVLSGASVIVVDPKGDLTNLALSFPTLSPAEFAPWVQEGQDPEKVAATARENLGPLAANVRRWHEAADVTIYAPGKLSGGGQTVNVFPSFEPLIEKSQSLGHLRAPSMIEAVLGMIGCEVDQSSPAVVFLTEAVHHAWRETFKALPVSDWPEILANPPSHLTRFSGLAVEDFFPRTARMKIARALVGFQRQSERWLTGQPLNIASLVGEIKPKVSVFSLRHLTDESDRMFFTTMLFTAIRDYMFAAPASNALRLLVVLDEAKGYLPPHPYSPPTKRPLCTLLAQARAQGIGLVIGTQNPNDIDYKALSNVGTWFLGKLRARDCARDLVGELASRQVDVSELGTMLSRHFMILKKDGTSTLTRMRWAYSYLRGPMNGDDLARLDARPAAVSTITGEAPFSFKVADPQSRPVVGRLVYRPEGGSWQHATLAGGQRQVTLPTTPEGLVHSLVWDSSADMRDWRGSAELAVELDGPTGKVYSEPSLLVVDNSVAAKL